MHKPPSNAVIRSVTRDLRKLCRDDPDNESDAWRRGFRDALLWVIGNNNSFNSALAKLKGKSHV